MQPLIAEQPAQPRPARIRARVRAPAQSLYSALRGKALAILLAFWVLQGCLYVFAVPPWQHPDEPTHFEHARLTADLGRLPAPNEVSLPLRSQITESMLRHNFWRGITQPPLNDQTLSTPYSSPLGIYTQSQPRLYYAVAAVWLAPWLGQPVDAQVYALRLLSVLLGAAVVTCAYVSARWLLPGHPYAALSAAAFIAFLPGFADIMSSVNNDALVNVLGALFFMLAALLVTHRSRWSAALGVLLLMGLTLAGAVATKATGLSLVAAVPLGLLAMFVARVVLLSAGRRILRMAVLALACAVLAMAVVLFVMGQGVIAPYLSGASDWLAHYLRINVSGTLKSLLDPQRVSYAFATQIVFQSFWAVFGWRHIYIAPALYGLPVAATLIAMAGLVVGGVRLLRGNLSLVSKHRLGIYGAFACAGVAVAWIAAVTRSQADQGMGPYQSHGRYAYVALVPFAILFVLGVLGLASARWQRRAAATLALVSAAFQLVCFWGFLFPYYH